MNKDQSCYTKCFEFHKDEIPDRNSEAYLDVYQKAISLLSGRNHFEEELRKKLIKRECQRELVDAVIEELKEKNYLNDLENARIYVEFRKDSKSIYYLKSKLYEKGVDQNIIHEILSELEIDEFDVALRIVMKKWNLKKDEEFDPDYDQITKICRSLGSKGFSYKTISRIREYLF